MKESDLRHVTKRGDRYYGIEPRSGRYIWFRPGDNIDRNIREQSKVKHHWKTYDEADQWLKTMQRKYGVQFTSSLERYVSQSIIDKLWTKKKKQWEINHKREVETAMKKTGQKIGDRVDYIIPGFMGVQRYTGVIIKHGVKRRVKLDVPVSGRKTLPWTEHCCKLLSAGPKPTRKARKKTPVRKKTPKPYTGKLSFWT